MNEVPADMVDTIITGDNVAVMGRLPDGCIDLTVTSPPYDNLRDYDGYTWDFEAVAAELWRVTKPGGVVVWVVGDATIDGTETGTSFRQALYFMGLGFRLHDTMIYETDKPPMNDNRYQACFEYMFVFSKSRPAAFNPIMVPSTKAGIRRTAITYRKENGATKNQWRGGTYNNTKVKSSIWYYPSGASVGTLDNFAFEHPATFPEDLPRDHILSWSNPHDIVLDPFCGSGTTCKAAVLLDRHFIGIEISPKYTRIARRRVEAVQIQPKLIPFHMMEVAQ